MLFDQYTEFLKEHFAEAVQRCIVTPDKYFQIHGKIMRPARAHYGDWGFRCISDAFDAAVPRSETLELAAWSTEELSIDHWKVTVSCRAFHIGCDHAHIEITNAGYTHLPFTETGYKSYFVPLSSFAGSKTPHDFVKAQFPEVSQMELF